MNVEPVSVVQAYRSSVEVLEDFREGLTVEDARNLNTSTRPAYSMANLYCGACIDTLCGIRELFKSVIGIDIDQASQLIYRKITGVKAHKDWEEFEFEVSSSSKQYYVTLLVMTPPCPDFSTGNPNPVGTSGNKGGDQLKRLPAMVRKLKPLVVFIEEVANLATFVDDLYELLVALHEQDLTVHAAVVSMAQYGDLENSWRLVIVAISSKLGRLAADFTIPLGDFSEDVAYCSAHVTTPVNEIPSRFHRFMQDYEITPRASKPGALIKIGQTAPGYGWSGSPNAKYSLRGLAPKSTTHGAGRHSSLEDEAVERSRVRSQSIRPGPPPASTKSYMFTPDEVARHKNMSKTVISLYDEVYAELGGQEQLHLTNDKFKYKCMGNGFSMKFGVAIYSAIHRLLIRAGVPYDIIRSEVNNPRGEVTHVQAEQRLWEAKMDKQVSQVTAHAARLTSMALSSGGQKPMNLYEISLDTGASHTLIWDNQDEFLKDRTQSKAVVKVAKAGQQFNTTSTGTLPLAVIKSPKDKASSRIRNMKVSSEDVQWLVNNTQRMEMPVVSAPKNVLRKQLLGFPQVFLELKLNLDLRQPEEGPSCMWRRHPDFPHDLSRRIEIPLRFDAINMEWTFQYVPVSEEMNAAMQAHVKATHKDLIINRSVKALACDRFYDSEFSIANMIDLFSSDGDGKQIVQFNNVDEDLRRDILDKIPENKRLEVVLSRHPDERNERGVKQYLPTKEKRNMLAENFHKWYGHVGTSKNCRVCALIRGCMKFMYRIVDKYIEIRMGYFWDMDTLTVNVRGYDATKYYTCLRDRGAKYIKMFNLQFKDHFVDLFDEWISYMRRDRIYEVYNWDFCSVIKADNDGVWMRKSKKWLALIEKHNIRMYYTNKDRKESNAHAERTIGLVETTAKGILLEKMLPPEDHPDAFDATPWLLNRFPPKAALARDSPDGDSMRPLEMLTMGQVSRAAINRQLGAFVLPGSLIWVHDAKALGSSVTNPKTVPRVVRRMEGHQVVCFSPHTKIEMKTDSYILVNPGSQVNWRDQMGIPYVKPYMSMAYPGDMIVNSDANKMNKLCRLVLPQSVQKDLKSFRMMTKMDFVKHVKDDRVLTIRPNDLERLQSELKRLGEEELHGQSKADAVTGSEENPQELLTSGTNGAEMESERAETSQENQPPAVANTPVATEEIPVTKSNLHAPEQPSMDDGFDPRQKRPILSPEERGEEQKRKRLKTSSNSRLEDQPVQSNRRPEGRYDIRSLQQSQAEIAYQQENPKRGLSADRYDSYKAATTINEAINLGSTMGDIKWDMQRGLWWPVERPQVLPDPVSGRGGQVVPLLAPENIITADVMSEDIENIVESNYMTVNNNKEEQGTKLNERILEWNEAIKESITTSQIKSFNQLATKLQVPVPLFGVYHKWLGVISDGNLDELKIGSLHKKGMRCRSGILIPKPSGSIWMQMVSDHYCPAAVKPVFNDDDTKLLEEEALQAGFYTVRAMTVLVRLAERVENKDVEGIEAFAARVRAKDNHDGIPPPPKGIRGLYSIEDPIRKEKFVQSLIKEFSALEEMGTISHLHSKDDLWKKFGIDIEVTAPVSTMPVFDNKFPDGVVDKDTWVAKSRVCVEGTPRQMTQGVHYDSVYAATPDQDSILFMNALVVCLKLSRRAFDVGNAYGWGKQEKLLALDYPRGFAQFNEKGEKLYMCLLKNTYGKPDGANLWYKERDSFWLSEFNNEDKYLGWSCRRIIMEQSLFEFKRSIMKDGVLVEDYTYLLAWSDDCDMAGTDEGMMEIIETACNNKWKVKQVSADFMLGIRRTTSILPNGDWECILTQTEFIDGLVGTWEVEVAEAGWGKKSPTTPIPPRLFLTADQKVMPVSEEEGKKYLDKGYKAVCGSLLWVGRFCHPEIQAGVSMCCRMMAKPNVIAWKCCMQIVAYLRDHKTIGLRYITSGGKMFVTSDSSNKGDDKDSKCMGSHTVQWMGGSIAHWSGKLPRIGAGSGATEFMALRLAGARVMKFRYLMKELGLTDQIAEPTIIYCDSNVALNWEKTGKVSKGNHYLNVDWHQPREWEQEGHMIFLALDTRDMITDLGTKACTEQEFETHVMVMKGYKIFIIKFPRKTMTLT